MSALVWLTLNGYVFSVVHWLFGGGIVWAIVQGTVTLALFPLMIQVLILLGDFLRIPPERLGMFAPARSPMQKGNYQFAALTGLSALAAWTDGPWHYPAALWLLACGINAVCHVIEIPVTLMQERE